MKFACRNMRVKKTFSSVVETYQGLIKSGLQKQCIYEGEILQVYKIKKAVRIPPNFLTISYEKP